MTCNNEMDHLLCTRYDYIIYASFLIGGSLFNGCGSGDGRLSVYDLRKSILVGQSDELDDELLSISVIKVKKIKNDA